MRLRNSTLRALLTLLCAGIVACAQEAKMPATGPFAVASTNLEVDPEFAGIGDELMHEYLLGRAADSGAPRFVADILRYPDAAWVTPVAVPDEPAVYGPASGLTLPVVTFVTFPSAPPAQHNGYRFPYHNAQYGAFAHMLRPGERPRFAEPGRRYPLVLLAHGASAHGLFDVGHAHRLSSHGYIVAVLTYGDERTAIPDDPNHHTAFLRPLLTRAVLDALLDSAEFGPHIDADNIGITGHSFGGFTALTLAGAPYQGNPATVSDPRIAAAVLAAPWVGDRHRGEDVFAFGPQNQALARVTAPMLCAYGSSDDVTPSSFILPAMKRLSGPTYVIELVDQPHVFEQGSWEDRDAWELLFFDAYLRDDARALEELRTRRSMPGGNRDIQHFDYQRTGAGR